MADFVGREEELAILSDFIAKPGSGLTYLRGRRRVGKSWLLKKFVASKPSCFYFSGAKDESDANTRMRFAEDWDAFREKLELKEIAPSLLSWTKIFKHVSQVAEKSSSSLTLILDEIQWIAKKQSGFVGLLKQIWIDWEQLGNIKVILCGSSNKFFSDNAGGEEKTLRGLKTRASIWVHPFTLPEVRRHFFPSWTLEEICLTYMMFGGVPYYLQRIETTHGLIHGVNKAAFTEGSIFLEEVNEVLSLEFNTRGVGPVKQILSVLGQDGSSQKSIVEKTGLSQSNVSELLDKLVEYKIVFKELPSQQKPRKNEAGYRYRMKDFFLNFYFQILETKKERIRNNRSGLLFPYECLGSKEGFYLPNFSGKAFELLVRSVLEDKRYRKAPIFEKMLLADERYTVGTYWSKTTQIDLMVEHAGDRISRIVECKWISRADYNIDTAINELLEKDYNPPKGYRKHHYLVVSHISAEEAKHHNQGFQQDRGVEIVCLEDLVY